ncbi:MAG: hypothetical protein ACXVCM_20520 [Ktedonobacteraceae bacterium]
MTVHQRPRDEAFPSPSPTSSDRRRWNWLRLAQVAWVMLALVLLGSFVANLPTYFQYVGTICTLHDLSNCETDQLAPIYVQFFQQLHITVEVAAGFFAALTFAVAVLYWVFGLLIFWRKSGEWMGLLASLLLVMLGSFGLVASNATEQTPQLLQLLNYIFGYIVLAPAILLFVFLFPTGRFIPRWTLYAFVLIFVVDVLSSLPVTTSLIPGVVVALTYPLPIIAQVYRYMHVYDTVQRQQTKWFVFGMSIVVALFLLESTLSAVAPNSPWFQLFTGPFWLLVWTILLFSVSIPILRYRLWEIDIIINRTLVYGSLTALLALIYFGLIFALQFLFQGFFKQNNAVIIVVSTLAIAALFQPLRHRIQAIIDRRFYRRKYDATKTLEEFSATLRNEVDLQQLREQLLTVVKETMQPAHVSLWLREPASKLPHADHMPPRQYPQ